MQKLLLILTGTSGSGKTTLCSRLLKEIDTVKRVITTTTRLPRKGEVHGVDYFFETNDSFQKKQKVDAFLEYAQVYGYYYGTEKASVLDERYQDKDLVISLDVQGAQTLKSRASELAVGRRLVTIFVCPASLDELKNRLFKRGTDDERTIQKRLQTAEMELRTLSQFDYHLCSQDREHDWLCLQHIYFAEKMRI